MIVSFVTTLGLFLLLSSSSFDASIVTATTLITLNMVMSIQDILGYFLFMDKISYWMIFVSLVVFLMSISYEKFGLEKILLISVSILLVSLYFVISDLFWFYVTFEASLIPLFGVIVIWGNSPERALAGSYMLLYTLVGSVPLMMVAISFKISSTMAPVAVLAFISFLVKVPIWLMHSWLTRAHVEATLAGSMLLAGVMLKLGAFGMIRLMAILPYNWVSSFKGLLFSLSILGSSLALLSAVSSDDMKASVAYASISHMNLIVAGLVSYSHLSSVAGTMLMVGHGILSPLLFFMVTKVYWVTGSRSVLLNTGNLSFSLSLKYLSCVLWALNFSIPPSLTFVSEVMLGSSIVSEFNLAIYLLIWFLTLSGIYSIIMYSSLNHSFKSSSFEKAFMLKGSFSFMVLGLFTICAMFGLTFLCFSLF